MNQKLKDTVYKGNVYLPKEGSARGAIAALVPCKIAHGKITTLPEITLDEVPAHHAGRLTLVVIVSFPTPRAERVLIAHESGRKLLFAQVRQQLEDSRAPRSPASPRARIASPSGAGSDKRE